MNNAVRVSGASAVARQYPSQVNIYNTIRSFREARHQFFRKNQSVGYVPTMGALHDGHLSLVEEARKRNDVVLASIFVNPTQFGKGEDLDKYPRQLERDCELLSEFEVDHVFAPNIEEMYSKNNSSFVSIKGFDDIPEGQSRPGHFQGVATVVTKLFNIVQPTRAYFGQKDAAQCALVKRIVQDLNMPLEVVICDTMREEDGLAMSSRNVYLSREERLAAPILYNSLMTAREYFLQNVNSCDDSSSIPSSVLSNLVLEILRSEPMVSQVQYVSVDDRETMRPIDTVDRNGAIISLACKIGSVRLIDNIVLSL